MVVFYVCCLFFFKQKTAYEMRISDWSSDVCSSDLAPFMSTIRPGAISVFKADGAPPERIFIDGGFAEVNEKGLNILAESATPVSDVDPALVDRDLANAREDVRPAKSPVEADISEKQVERLAAPKQALGD